MTDPNINTGLATRDGPDSNTVIGYLKKILAALGGTIGIGTGTAGTPSTAVVTVQGITGGTVVPVSIPGVALGGALTWSDKTITSLSGSSQTLIAANANRKAFIIKNGAVSSAINILAGTAAIGGAGCMTLQPYEGFAMVGAECTLLGITVIGTAANYVSAYEAV